MNLALSIHNPSIYYHTERDTEITYMSVLIFCVQAVRAEGNSLVDLLDNYMKNCIDKKIVPIGGVLHLVYDEAWNPPGQFSS